MLSAVWARLTRQFLAYNINLIPISANDLARFHIIRPYHNGDCDDGGYDDRGYDNGNSKNADDDIGPTDFG